MLLVISIRELWTPDETFTFHNWIMFVVIGGIVSIVVSVVLTMPLEVET